MKNNTFYKQLKELRDEKGFSQRKLATELEVTQACIAKWETGNREPSLDDIIRIAQYFGVSTDYLLGLED